MGNTGWSTKTENGVTKAGHPDMRLLAHRYLEWRDAFLADFKEYGIIQKACKAAGISRSQYLRALETIPEFKEMAEQAKEEAIEKLEERARQRAMTSSDNLMMFLLKAARPDVYRDNFKHQISAESEITITEEQRVHVLRTLITDPSVNAAVHGLLGIALGNPGGASNPTQSWPLAAGQTPPLLESGADGRGIDGEPLPDSGDATPAREE